MKQTDLEWKDGVPVSSEFGDVYYSLKGGLEESQFVFLQACGLPERWKTQSHPFVVGELGFGTGLNFFATWKLWRETFSPHSASHSPHHSPGSRLIFVTCEKFPLSEKDARKALEPFPEIHSFSEQLLSNWFAPTSGFHVRDFPSDQLRLIVYHGDVHPFLDSLSYRVLGRGRVGAWYLDGFDPAKNEDMWSESVLRKVADASAPQARLGTFTAAGRVRRGLQKAGFEVERVPGFAGKRERLQGALQPRDYPADQLMWARPDRQSICPDHAIVVGAGLAGAAVARSLADRGVEVLVLEKNREVASGASGNPKALLMPVPSAQGSALTRLTLLGMDYLSQSLSRFPDVPQNNPGVLQLAHEPRFEERFKQASQLSSFQERAIQYLSPNECSEKLGWKTHLPGLFYPQGGWVSPVHLVESYLDHPRIHVISGIEVEQVVFQETGWRVHCGNRSFEAPMVVATAGVQIPQIHPFHFLPIRKLKGQLFSFSSSEFKRAPRCPVAFGHYLVGDEREFVLGASHHPKVEEEGLDPTVGALLWSSLRAAFPEEVGELPSRREERWGFRNTAPDTLPIVGELPDPEFFRQSYVGFHSVQKKVEELQSYPLPRSYRGLWVLSGLGARGVIQSAIGSEVIAAQALGEPLFLEADLPARLHPARFLMRELKSTQK